MARKPGRYKPSLKIDQGQMDRLKRAMDLFADEVKEKVNDAIKESAEAIQDTAQSNVKVVTGKLSNKIKDAIIVREWKPRKETLLVWDVGMDRNYNEEFYVYSKGETQFRMYHGYNRKVKDPRWEKKQWYLPTIMEYGTPRSKAKPFLRPALRTHRKTAKNLVAQALREVTSRDY